MDKPVPGRKRIIGMTAVWLMMLLMFGVVWGKAKPWIPLLDDANVLIHESGHVFMAEGSELLAAVGGTIMQLLIPLLAMAYFIYRKDYFGAVFGCFWVGDNLVNISVYIKDARTRLLPLINEGAHDWHRILGSLNALESDMVLGNLTAAAGYLLMLTALGWGAYLIFSALKQRVARPLI